jgi:hypothetical protein
MFENRSVPWYKSSRDLLIAAGILLLVAIVVVVPSVFAIVLTRNPIGKVTFITIV